MSEQIVSQIEKVIEERIRPALQMDGGDIEFIGYENGVVKVRLQGACVGCPGAAATLKHGVESLLKSEVDGVESVESV